MIHPLVENKNDIIQDNFLITNDTKPQTSDNIKRLPQRDQSYNWKAELFGGYIF